MLDSKQRLNSLMNAPVVFSVGEVGWQGSSGAEIWT